jgi:uncharacterized membrane protein YcaP (DUF421 family)
LDLLLEGSPVLLVRNGTVYETAMRRGNLTRGELKESMRKRGCIRIEDVRLAVLESNGEISIVTREDSKE